MKIKKLILNNFRAFKYAEINFDNFNCIIGKNDTGKSTILAALEWFFDQNRELNENDFAAAGFDWYEHETPAYYDEITGETYQGECVKEFIYDDFYISVEIYFSDATLQNRTDECDFIFSKDFVSKDGNICIEKYMYHPFIDKYPPSSRYQMGYRIKTQYFEKIEKPLSYCTIEELKTAYNEIGKNADVLCKRLNQLEEERNNKRKRRGVGTWIINTEIHDEVLNIKEQICSELYNHYKSTGERICEGHGELFENLDSIEAHFGLIFPLYKLYTSKTPINDYLNALFTPYNASKVYKPIEEAKFRAVEKLSEFLNLDGKNDIVYIKEKEKIDLFTQDSLVFRQKDFPLRIPLKNRGEGMQLKIKNAVFRLLTEIQTKNQINIVFAFEEPETHLHPSAQLEMYETIKDISKKSDYQVIITTHSPYIVKELAIDGSEPIVIIREEGANESIISNLEKRVLPYVSMNEMNYIAFDEPSIEYHIELFGFIQQAVDGSPDDVDKCLFKNNFADRTYDYYFIDPKTEDLIPDTKGGFQHAPKTLPYCVRNQIDHPHDYNKQYGNRNMVEASIEIMRNAIISNPTIFNNEKEGTE